MLSLLFMMSGAIAQQAILQTFAATLQINAADVRVQLAGAQNALSVRPGASLPISVGDEVRTDRFGRAWVDFAPLLNGRALVMPNSVVRIDVMTENEVIVSVISGRLVFTIEDAAPTLIVVVGEAFVSNITGNFAVQVEGGIGHVIASTGRVDVGAFGETTTLEAGYGMRVSSRNSEPVLLGDRANFARIDGILDGCPGEIRARGEQSLNVRVGPAFGYDALGSEPNGTAVFLMAVNPTGERYRIQFLSGFGWVLANGVLNQCENLPELPMDTIERIVRIYNVRDDELNAIRPYFGDIEDDRIFYVFTAAD
jgi:hypothetical protein